MQTQAELTNLVDKLISYGKEGVYWDFKQEFYKNLIDLLYDVTCMSNAAHEGDRFIIFGITDNLDVIGVNDHPHTQASIIDYLRSMPYAENSYPQILFDKILYLGQPIHVLTIKNEPKKPFYFIKDKKPIRAGSIYSRNHDSNTPKDSCATPSDIEDMWKERFGLNLNISDKFIKILKEHEHWQSDGCSSAYYTLDPNMTLETSNNESIVNGNYWWSRKRGHMSLRRFKYTLMSAATTVFEIEARISYFDHLSFPFPKTETVTYPKANDSIDAKFYCDIFYYAKNTIEHSLLEYMVHNNLCSFNAKNFIVSGTKTHNAIIKLPFFVIDEQDLDMLKKDYLDAYSEFISSNLYENSILDNESTRLSNEEKFSMWAFEKLSHKYSK